MAGHTGIKLIHVPEHLNGTVQLPISKSLSNRALILEHLTGAHLIGDRISDAHDTQLLNRLLASVDENDHVDVEDAGTVARFMLALCATKKGRSFTLSGSDRMHLRPIKDLVNALRQMGVDIEYLGKEGCLPIALKAPDKLASTVRVETSTSSQFLSALLLISPALQLPFRIQTMGSRVSLPYVNMTTKVLENYGYQTAIVGDSFTISRTELTKLPTSKRLWESDWSAAIYFLLINGLHTSSRVLASNLFNESLQGDRQVLEVLEALGMHLQFQDDLVTSELVSTPADLLTIDLKNSPDLAQPIIAFLAAKNIKAHLTGLVTLQHKESDRLAAMATELKKMGAAVAYTQDSFTLLKGIDTGSEVALETYKDHRMAMSLFLIQLVNPKAVVLEPGVVKKSFPSFWQTLEGLGFKFEITHDAV